MSVCQRRRSRAFTVIEVAIVVLIAGLATVTFSPAALKMMESAQINETEGEITDLIADIDKFIKDNGRLPDDLVEVFGEVPLDPWGNPYQYLNFDTVTGNGKKRKDKNLVPINTDYDFYSMGPDGKTATPLTAAISQDDIVRARDGAYVGVASDY
ncbi:MAG: prepilin-type cleavage/methylation domain-containing protein [Gammaproteobacteria bacterium]